jgi:hypothetical protein
MALESAQLLSSVHRIYDINTNIYKITHINHPCTVWTRLSSSNYHWLYKHFVAISKEYTLRYNKIHKSFLLLNEYLMHPPNGMLDIGLTKFVQAMPDIYKTDNPVIAYRSYYVGEKSRFSKWSYPSDVPYWFNTYRNLINFNILKQSLVEELFEPEGVLLE